MEDKTIRAFLNNDLSKSVSFPYNSQMNKKDVFANVCDGLRISNTPDLRLFEATGDELSDDDIESLEPNNPIFVSTGEDFREENCLGVYRKIKTLGKDGFGTVRMY